MGWFIAAVSISAKTLVISAGVVAAVGVVVYGIYKVDQHFKEKKHRHNKKSKSIDKKKSAGPVFYEDIKPKVQNIEDAKYLRLRHVDSNLDTEKDRHQAATLNNKSIEKCDQETQAAIQNNLTVTKCHQETQATPPNNLSVPKSHQETQTDGVLPAADLPVMNIAAGNSNTDYNIANSMSSNGADSIYSFDSMSSGSSTTSNIPKWSEMSNEERNLCKCSTSCGKLVSTVTYPCEHPYFCGECAPIVFKSYHRCPKCKHRIKSFDNV